MRLIKIFGLGAVAAVAAMALVGATSASATSTQLCKSHDALTCDTGEGATSVGMVNQGPGVLLTNLVDVLCLTISVSGTALALANPQLVHITALSFTNCGTKAAHDNCTITVLELPLTNLLKTGLDTGTITGTNGETLVECENIDIFGIDIHCIYDATGLQFSVGAQDLTASKTKVDTISGSLCPSPSESFLDGLLTTEDWKAPEDPTPVEQTTLCKTHTEPCAEKNQVKSIDMATTKAPVLYNTVANVECESSLAAATVLSPAEPQKLDVTSLTWKECHTQGAAENCTVTTSSLPTIDLDATALNLGSAATSGLEIEVDCLILDLIELDCTYDSDMTLGVEGASHKAASGHGRFTAAKTVLELAEGGEHCPDEMKWDPSYEAAQDLYVVLSSAEEPPAPLGGPPYILA
jgi:hypothetical protein